MIEFDATPFSLDVSRAAVQDLEDRVARFRIPDGAGDPEDSSGLRPATLQFVIDVWQRSFDWRATQRCVNEMPNRMALIDDAQPLHLISARAAEGSDPTYLLLLNGWPATPLHWRDVLAPLCRPSDSDSGRAFHVIAPTMPGFTLSGPAKHDGWSPARLATVYAELLSAMGVDSYLISASDFGSMVALNLASIDAHRVAGLHLGTAPLMRNYTRVEAGLPPRWVDPQSLNTDEQRRLQHDAERFLASAPARHVHSAIPRTLGYALADSPVGLLAWFYGAWLARRKVLSEADVLRAIEDTCLYWFTGTAASSLRMYREVANAGSDVVPTGRTGVPTGVTIARDDVAHTPRQWVERYHNVVYWAEDAPGGHFPMATAPNDYVNTIREFARAVADSG